ncbi:MAG: TonB-dependent receptor [Acidobacteria bacterium]|nr:TonB-dependent receptor [Acidobacteriota bacterium]
MTRLPRIVTIALSVVSFALGAGAQTVTSTTGAINGTVTDSTKAVLPGATVTLSGPALMGTTTAVTDQNGFFRFSTVSVGDYKLTFELSGFGAITREGIHVSVGFTATVNAEMNPGALAENVTVSGASPVVDIQATKVANHFDSEKLAELPGSRDAWAVVAQTPGVAMSRMDVGGSGAWTQQTFQAYGVGGGERNEVEGIMVNEGAGQMYYTDFASFEEISVTAAGNTAEVGTPGAFSNFVSKSGSNTYHGTMYLDFENESMESHNIDAAQIAAGVKGSQYLATEDLNRLSLFRDFTADIGGFVQKDKLWWYFSYRNNVADLRFPTLVDDIQHTYGPVYSVKGTFNVNANHRFAAYYQHAGKVQPDYLGAIALPTGRDTTAIMHADTVWSSGYPNDISKGEYNATLSNRLFLMIRGGAMKSFWYRDYKSSAPRIEDISNNFVSGGVFGIDNARFRPQVNASLSYFKDGLAGTHNFKFGAEIMRDDLDQPFRGFGDPCQCVSVLSNGAPRQVYLYKAGANSLSRLWAYTGYANDSWQVNRRLTLNLGLRLDRYRPYLPEQAGPGGQTFAAVDEVLIWSNLGPRVGASFDLTGKGRTLVKANYGKYWLYPAGDFAGTVNPNPPTWREIYTWNDANGNGRWDSGEQVGSPTSVSGGTASTIYDPDIQNTFSHQALAFIEHEAAPNLGVRTGFVWNGRRQLRGSLNINRPVDAYTVPIQVRDPGPDGRIGTADDGALITAYNLAPGYLSLPVVNRTINLGSGADTNYYTWEVSATRRQVGSWSLLASFVRTWAREGAIAANATPNLLINTVDGQNRYTTWQAKLNATLTLPWDLRVTPILRHQSGTAFARTFSAALNYSSAVTIKAEPLGDERTPNITLFDVRAEKVIRVNQTRFSGFFDLYNIFNANPPQALTTTSGSAWLFPSAITAPRIARVGLKMAW